MDTMTDIQGTTQTPRDREKRKEADKHGHHDRQTEIQGTTQTPRQREKRIETNMDTMTDRQTYSEQHRHRDTER